MKELEYSLDSLEVAEMVEKNHKELLRDIKRYINQMIKGNEEYGGERKIAPSDFFKESTYKTERGKEYPCYRITKKGCEFIAHKLTGTKGTIFTARYINRFHEMEDILSQKESEPQLPWFIRKFGNQGYVMLFRDFETVTGVSIYFGTPFWKAHCDVMNNRCPLYWNGWGWYTVIDKEEFLKEYGFEYGDEKCMTYLYPCGIRKALQLCREDKRFKIEQSAYDMIMDGLKAIEPPKKQIEVKKPEPIKITQNYGTELPMQVNIIFGNREMSV